MRSETVANDDGENRKPTTRNSKNELVREYIPADFQVKSFYLTKLLVKHDLTKPQLNLIAKSVCVIVELDLRRALHRICNANMSPVSFVAQNISFRPTFLTAIESNIIRDSTSSRSSGFGHVCDPRARPSVHSFRATKKWKADPLF